MVNKKKSKMYKLLDKDVLDPKVLRKLFTHLLDTTREVSEQNRVTQERITRLEKNLDTRAEEIKTLLRGEMDEGRQEINEHVDVLEKDLEARTETLDQAHQTFKDLITSKNEELRNDTTDRFNSIMEILLEKEKVLRQDLESKFKLLEDIFDGKIAQVKEKHENLKDQYLFSTKRLEENVEILRMRSEVKESERWEDIEEFVRDQVHEMLKGHEKIVTARHWIRDLKRIAKDLTKLKKASPMEFQTKIREISDVVLFYENQMRREREVLKKK